MAKEADKSPEPPNNSSIVSAKLSKGDRIVTDRKNILFYLLP